MRAQEGFALLTAVILSLVFAAALGGLYAISSSLLETTVLYERVDSVEAAQLSASNLAAEVIEQLVLDGETQSGSAVKDPDLLVNDLVPSALADFTDDVRTDPDLEIPMGRYTALVDIDWVPLTMGFAWNSIKFGMGYQEASAGGSTMGSQTYRVQILIRDDIGGGEYEHEGIYVLNTSGS